MIGFDVFYQEKEETCMRITELLQDATIDLGVKVNSKEEAIDHLVDLMVKGGNITDREEYKKGILAREANEQLVLEEGLQFLILRTKQ